VRNSKQQLEKLVGHPVQKQLDPGIIDNTAALCETCSENAIVTLLKDLPVAFYIAAIIGLVSHHNDDGISLHGIQSTDDRTAKAVWPGATDRNKRGDSFLQRAQNLPGRIRASVIDGENLVGHPAQPELDMQMFYRRSDASFLVARWDNHGE
jgi:hypothetical protein